MESRKEETQQARHNKLIHPFVVILGAVPEDWAEELRGGELMSFEAHLAP